MPQQETDILDANVRYHDLAAAHYDSKWGINYDEVGQAQVTGKLRKALGHEPGHYDRALEIGAEAILMAKNGVRGVYDGDPRLDPNATFLPEITHLEAIERGLRVMDTTALSLCMDNGLPIHVFELADGNVVRAAAGERIGTIVATPEREW